MCQFKLEVCPYPHHDPIRALIFLPGNAALWQACAEPKPWGRLSCGSLTIQHDRNISDGQPPTTADCKWCTAVLKLVATKSKEIQQLAREEIVQLEEKLNSDQDLTKIRTEMEKLEKKLAGLKAELWDIRLAKGMDGGSSDWEELNGDSGHLA